MADLVILSRYFIRILGLFVKGMRGGSKSEEGKQVKVLHSLARKDSEFTLFTSRTL